MQRLFAAFTYALIVFGIAFVIGAIREVFIVPHTGLVTALMIEFPIMVAVIAGAAIFIFNRLPRPQLFAARLAIGLLGLGLMLAAENMTAYCLRGVSAFAQWHTVPPEAQIINVTGLAVLVMMPLLIGAFYNRSDDVGV